MGFETLLFIASSAYQVVSYQKAKRKQEREAEKRRGMFIPIRGEARGLPVIYGKQRIAGIELNHRTMGELLSTTSNADVYFDMGWTPTTGNHTAGKNSYLMFNTAIANVEGTRLDSCAAIFVDEVHYRQKDKKFTHAFELFFSGGTASDLGVNNGYPSTNTFTNTAYATNYFLLNRKEQQYSGIPRVEYLIKGNHIRGISSGTPTARRYSNNSAEVLFDYLTAPYGADYDDSEIDMDSFESAIALCNLVKMVNQEFGGHVNGIGPLREYANFAGFPSQQSIEDNDYWGYDPDVVVYKDLSTGDLYNWNDSTNQYDLTTAPLNDVKIGETNITIDTERSVRENIQDLVDEIPFASLVWSNEGKFKLLMNYPDDQADWDALVAAAPVFDDDDILNEESVVNYGDASGRFNHVTVDFLNEFENFANDSISWPPKTGATYTTYLSEDNNKRLETTIQSNATTPYHAQAEAEHMVRESREDVTAQLTMKRGAMVLEPGDIFVVSSNTKGVPTGTWLAERVRIDQQFRIKVDCSRISFNMFAWNVDNDIPYAVQNYTNFDIEPVTNLVATPGIEFLANGVVNAYVDLTWDSEYESGVEFIIDYIVDGESAPTRGSRAKNNSIRIENLKLNTLYDFEVETELISGKRSDAVTVQATTAADGTVPKAPTNLSVVADWRTSKVSWDAVTQNVGDTTIEDLEGYNVYRGLSDNPTTFLAFSPTAEYSDTGLSDSTQYYYRVTAVDKYGNESTYSASANDTTNAELVDGATGISPSYSAVSTQTITYNPDTTSYSASFLDFDFIFYQGSDVVGRNRYRVSRSGSTWSATASDRSGDITNEVNVSRLTPSVSVSSGTASLTVTYSYLGEESQISVPVQIVSDGIKGDQGEKGDTGDTGEDAIYGVVQWVDSPTISKNPDTGVYTPSSTSVEFDAIFYEGTTKVAQERFRFTRIGDTWSTSISDPAGDSDLNTARTSDSNANVNGQTATTTVTYSYLGKTASIDASVQIVIDGAAGDKGDTQVTGKVWFSTLSSTAPPTPTASSYNTSTGQFTNLTSGWQEDAPPNDLSNATLKAWYSLWTVTIDGVTSDQTISFGAAQSVDQFVNQLTSDLLANDAVVTAKLDDLAVTAGKVADNAITVDKVANDAITNAKIAVDAVGTTEIQDLAINSAKVADAAIATAKLADGAITEVKIGTDAVTTAKIAANAITSTEISTDAITSPKILAGAVVAGKLAAGSVTAGDIAANAVEAGNIAANAVTAGAIAANAVTAGTIAANAITATEIATGAVTADAILANAVTAVAINADAVTTDKIAANSITSAKIGAGAVVAGKIGADAITATEIAADAVGADQIAANAVVAGKINTGAVTSDTIAANAVTAGKIAANAVTAGTIAANAITATEIDVANLSSLSSDLGSVDAGNLDITDSITSPPVTVGARIYPGTATVSGSTGHTTNTMWAVNFSDAYETVEFQNYGDRGVLTLQGNIITTGGNHDVLSVIGRGGAGSAVGYFHNNQTGGGEAQIGLSSGDSGYAFNSVDGGYYDGGGDGYNPFTGRHEGFIKTIDNIEPGDIVCDKRVLVREVSDSMTEVVLSTQREERGAIGVYAKHFPNWKTEPGGHLPASLRDSSQEEIDLFRDRYELITFNSVGEGGINVCGLGGNIRKGDLICTSPIPGKGMKHRGTVVRNYSVAKAREDMTFDTPDQVKMIACIYLCG